MATTKTRPHGYSIAEFSGALTVLDAAITDAFADRYNVKAWQEVEDQAIVIANHAALNADHAGDHEDEQRKLLDAEQRLQDAYELFIEQSAEYSEEQLESEAVALALRAREFNELKKSQSN